MGGFFVQTVAGIVRPLCTAYTGRVVPCFALAAICLSGAALFSAPAKAQDPAPDPSMCDRLAANPADPQRRAPGVVWEAMDAPAAVSACAAAIAQVPNDPRFLYQYGRTLDRAGRLGEAIAYYQEAAALNYPMADYVMGGLLRQGEGIKRDPVQALAAYQRAADQNIVQAKFWAADMLVKGEGVAKADIPMALTYLTDAAQQGYGRAQASLAMLYLSGAAGKEKIGEGRDWLYKAADQGLASAQAELGNLYAEGTLLPRDLNLAEAWYKKAAQQDNADGMLGLAFLYWADPGKKREAEAADLFTQAALRGKAPAMATLVLIHQYGQGVPAAPAEAFAWAILYGEYDAEGKSAQEKLKTQLSPTDQQKGMDRAAQLRQEIKAKAKQGDVRP